MTTCDDLPAALWLERDVRVVVCAEHGSAYTQANLDCHLVEAHHVKPAARRRIREYFRQEDGIARDMVSVGRPRDGAAPITGLPALDGFSCTSSASGSPGLATASVSASAAAPASGAVDAAAAGTAEPTPCRFLTASEVVIKAACPARPHAWASSSCAAATTTSVALAFAARQCAQSASW